MALKTSAALEVLEPAKFPAGRWITFSAQCSCLPGGFRASLSGSMPSAFPSKHWNSLVLVVLLGLGAWLRWDAASRFKPMGPDEHFYGVYVSYLSDDGLGAYPNLVEQYIEAQQSKKEAILPPTRAFYIAAATILRQATGGDPKQCLNAVSALCSFFMLPIGYIFIRRLAGIPAALITTGLMVTAPMQLHMAGHALIDITISLWALLGLWTLWEAMSDPGNRRKLAALALVLAGLIVVKENAFFVVIGLGGIVISNRWFQFGKVTPALLLTFVIGVGIGVGALALLSGGFGNVIETYRLLVKAAYNLPYAAATGDGPWHRYVYELTLVSPLIACLTLLALASLSAQEKGVWYMAAFIGATYFVMANLKYAMNLRYTNMWDLPMRFMAAIYLLQLGRRFSWRAQFWLPLAALLLASYDWRQYRRMFVDHAVYEPVTIALLRSSGVLNDR